MTTDPAADEEPARVPIRVSAEGVNVRKIASTKGDEAVVVDLTIRSGRDETCTVRIEDAIPDALRDNPLEFHPRYDPDNWTHEADSVVYEAPIGPGVVRRTVYGVIVDDPSQRDLFLRPPDVAVVEGPPPADGERPGDEPFEFGAAEGSGAGDDGPTGRNGSPSLVEAEPRRGASVVDALVSELRRRDLTRAERAALREAVGFEVDPAALDAIRDAVAGLEDTTDGLSTQLAALEVAVEREVAWRSELRELLVGDFDEG